MGGPFELLPPDRLRWVLEKFEDAITELDTERRIQERLAWAIYRVVAVVPEELPAGLRLTFGAVKETVDKTRWRGGEPVMVALRDAECEGLARALVDLRDELREAVAGTSDEPDKED